MIALDGETRLKIAVNALVAIGRNIATMDHTVTDRAIVLAMGLTISSVRAATFARAWAEGQAMALEQAAEYLLGDEG